MIRVFNLEFFSSVMIFNVREKLISLIYDTVTLIWIHKGGSARDRIINIFIRRIQAREKYL